MSMTYILIANASQAQLYASPQAKLYNGHAKLDLITNEVHPESRLRRQDLISDKSGHLDSGTCSPEVDAHELEKTHFAKELSDFLKRDFLNDKFDNLIIAAPPKFSGMLNRCMDEQVKESVFLTIQKDYTHIPQKKLLAYLQTYL